MTHVDTKSETTAAIISPAGITPQVNEIDEQIQQHLTPLYWDWVKLFEDDPHANLNQHPEKVLQDLQTENESAHAWQVRTYDGETLCNLATLIPKTINTKFAGTLGIHHQLRGFRLAGNRICGDVSEAAFNDLLPELFDHLTRLNADFLLIEDLDEQSPLFEQIQQIDRQNFHVYSPTGIQERLRISFPEQSEEYWKKFSSKTRYKFRRLARLFGDHRVEKVTRVDQIAEFLDHANQISRNSWQAKQIGLRIKNDERELREFTFLAEQNMLRSYLLYREEQPVAFVIGNQFNGVFQYEEVGYDAEFFKLSPGQVLLLKLLEDLVEHNTPQVLDFGGGDAEYKRVFSNAHSKSGSFWMMPRTVRSRLVLSHLSCSQAIRNGGKSLLSKLGLFRKLRQNMRKKTQKEASTKNQQGEK